ncbi:MAG: DUF234 domain-containing protein [Candidatus Eremiobacteraeota bacterium]|nr:DUF234 domain-containing protein [Candidatus Eremiobacteraeota bacterium]
MPVNEEHREKSKKGLYLIADNFIRFWFRFVFPYMSDIEIGACEEVLSRFDHDFPGLVAGVYEKARPPYPVQ